MWSTRKQSRFDLKDFSLTTASRTPIPLHAEHPVVFWPEIRLDSQVETPCLAASSLKLSLERHFHAHRKDGLHNSWERR
jgi:hypothetical protein